MKKVHDDSELFMILTLETVSSGLNRKMVQNKKDDYMKAFFKFDIKKVSKMSDEKIAKLLESDSKIIKNKGKVNATVNNAQKIIKIQEEFGSFDKYIREFAKGKKDLNFDSLEAHWLVTKMIEDMKFRGFKFIGKTGIQAFLIMAGVLSYTKKQEDEYNGRRKKS